MSVGGLSMLGEQRGLLDITLFCQIEQDLLGSFDGGDLTGVDDQIGVGWRDVGIGNTGNSLDFTGPGFGVEAFTVALFADFDGS